MFYRELCRDSEHSCAAWYLNHIDRKNMVTLARFRTRNHHLAIEVGEWLKIPVENRVCYTCMEVEDEAHLVFECTRYADLRATYVLWDYDVTADSQAQLVALLNCKDAKILNNLAIFVRKSLERHTEFAEAYFRDNT